MKRTLIKIGRRLGIISADLLIRRQPNYPDAPIHGGDELVLVEADGLKKWACLVCPGGCGTTISLSLNPNRRPRWTVMSDWFDRPTVSPSVHQKNTCGCHFWIKRGKIEWCQGGRPSTSKQQQDQENVHK